MSLPAPSRRPQPRLAPLPEHCEAVLRLLGAHPPGWEEVTSLVLRDPFLLYGILEAAPLGRQRLGSSLRREVAQRLEMIGTELLRAWLLQLAWESPSPDAAARALARRALLVAECALHLALETRHPHPDEAYLAGLWHSLGEQWLAAHGTTDGDQDAVAWPGPPAPGALPNGPGTQASELAALLAERCQLPGPLVDTLAMQHALEEQLLAAHPLGRLLWAGRKLAVENWLAEADRVAGVCGLSCDAVLSLRTDVGYLVAPPAPPANPSSGVDLRPVDAPARGFPAADQAWGVESLRDIAMTGLLRGAFPPREPGLPDGKLAIACRLLCDAGAPLVVLPDDRGIFRALPLTPASEASQWYDELEHRLDDETSVIALAARTGGRTHYTHSAGQPLRSPHDWHVARWLGGKALVCLPLRLQRRTGEAAGVAIVASDGLHPPAPSALGILGELSRAAAQRALDMADGDAARSELGERIEGRFREHARRMAHEANNPLTVIRNYLEIIARRQGDEPASEMRVVQSELDRLGELLRRAGELPAEAPEPSTCQVPELMEDLRLLYGETLFTRRGIRLELRVPATPASAAMPASALKQVLLNLFRNASEALQPGSRFSVTVPGPVSWNGVPCVEIRLIDNGPGLPPARLADLFGPQPSDKGRDHQGLGLAIVRDILAKWRASILCRSQPNVGTSFQLFIPLDKSD